MPEVAVRSRRLQPSHHVGAARVANYRALGAGSESWGAVSDEQLKVRRPELDRPEAHGEAVSCKRLAAMRHLLKLANKKSPCFTHCRTLDATLRIRHRLERPPVQPAWMVGFCPL